MFSLFWPILPILRKMQNFSKTQAVTFDLPYGSLTLFTISRKTNEWISRKMRYGQKNGPTKGRMDGRAYPNS